MKKLFVSVMIIASTITFTSAQRTSVEASKWSIAIKGGGTYFRVTPIGNGYTDDMSWGAGLAIERTVNPIFGMGLDISYMDFTRQGLDGKTIDPTLFGAFNLSNLVFPYREKSSWNVYAKAGVGAGFYSNDISGVKDNGISPVFMGSLHPEVALSKNIALGVEFAARYYSKELLGGQVSKDRFDDALTLLATLRFNLGSEHVRNMTMTDFYPASTPAPVVMQTENNNDDSQLINRLDDLDRQGQDIQNRLKKLEQDVKDLQNKPVGSSTTVSFQNVEFKFDSSELTEESYPTLNQIAAILKDNPTWSALKVQGHTDSVGPESYNQSLSERRTQSVKNYLVSLGIAESVVSTEGFGESKPIASNDTAEGRQTNRRVEFEVVK
ncbi:MAG: OmpA family protein [Paludibacteraceae bacterium]